MDDVADKLFSTGPKKGFGFSEIRGHFEVASKICFWEIFFSLVNGLKEISKNLMLSK